MGQDAVRQSQRQRILQTTVDLVSDRGYNETSVERICKEAGVSFPTFRKHFRDKNDCFFTAFDETVREANRLVAEAMDGAGSEWVDRVAAGLGTILEAIQKDRARARLCLVEVLSAGPEGIERYEATVRLCIAGLRPGREACSERGERPLLLEETIAGGVAWTIHQKVALGESDRIEELLAPLLEGVVTPYLGDRAARRVAEQQCSAR